MDDLISRKKVMQLARDVTLEGGIKHRCIDATQIWEVPSAQPEQRWIPWNDRILPKDSGWYIVTAYDGNRTRVTFAKYQKRMMRWDLTGSRAYWRVLAWMPLPEPYKEGDTDE